MRRNRLSRQMLKLLPAPLSPGKRRLFSFPVPFFTAKDWKRPARSVPRAALLFWRKRLTAVSIGVLGALPSISCPYPVDHALETLKDYEVVILLGTREPVSFFAYPDKPSRLSPEVRRSSTSLVLTRTPLALSTC